MVSQYRWKLLAISCVGTAKGSKLCAQSRAGISCMQKVYYSSTSQYLNFVGIMNIHYQQQTGLFSPVVYQQIDQTTIGVAALPYAHSQSQLHSLLCCSSNHGVTSWHSRRNDYLQFISWDVISCENYMVLMLGYPALQPSLLDILHGNALPRQTMAKYRYIGSIQLYFTWLGNESHL